MTITPADPMALPSRRRPAAAAWAWVTAITEFLSWSRAAGAPATTLRTRREHLQLLAKAMPCGPWEVTTDDLIEWFASRDWKPNTRRSRRTTYRAFYAWAIEREYVEKSPAHKIPAGEVPRPNPRPVPDRTYARALQEAGPRERLICRLAAEQGLRRAEVAVIHSRDLYEDLGGWTLVVHGKGGRERHVPLLDDIARELRALPAGWAFPGRDGGHLSPRWVGKLITRLLPADYTMHKLRHRAGTRWYDASDHDLFAVQELLGHASPATTRIYVAVDAKRLRRTVREGASS
ncbi:MAG TPA: tyrosine-type recombinase/integrase [Nocardioides sp.]|nr:tyrosine-type recombinase/integrase [Nocardioides sp.]